MKFSTTSWHASSYIVFKGAYNQHLYNSAWISRTIKLMMYTPIKKNSNWIVCLTGRSSHWTELGWSQGSNIEKRADEIASYVNYMRIFVRKVIQMPATIPAAYEIRIKYNRGVIIYVNGYEIFRDNMKDGMIKQDDLPIDAYSSYDYRGTVRNGNDLGQSAVVVAVEVHSKEIITSFDGWLTMYGSSYGYSSFVNVYYYPVTEFLLFGHTGYAYPCDFSYTTSLYSDTYMMGTFFDFEIGSGQCNGFMYYVTSDYGAMKNVTVEGYHKVSGKWETIMSRSIVVQPDAENLHGDIVNFHSYTKIRVSYGGVTSLPVGWTEIRPFISYQYIIRNTPDVKDVSKTYKTNELVDDIVYDPYYFSCSYLVALPKGLSLSDNCILKGQPTDTGRYDVACIITDSYGPRYATVVIIITEGDPVHEDLYDTSYSSDAKTKATFLVILVLFIAIIAIFFVLKPEKKKQLPLMTLPSPVLKSPLNTSMTSSTVNPVSTIPSTSPSVGFHPMSTVSTPSQPMFVLPNGASTYGVLPGMMPAPSGTPNMMPAPSGTPGMMPVSTTGTPGMMPVPSGTPNMMPVPGTPNMIPTPTNTPGMVPVPSGSPVVVTNLPKNP